MNPGDCHHCQGIQEVTGYRYHSGGGHCQCIPVATMTGTSWAGVTVKIHFLGIRCFEVTAAKLYDYCTRGQDYKRFSSMSRCSTHNRCSEMT